MSSGRHHIVHGSRTQALTVQSTTVSGGGGLRERLLGANRKSRKAGRAELVAGGVMLIAVLLFAVAGPAIVGTDPYAMNADDRLLAPCVQHPLGTDDFGRDILVRMMYGARTSLLVGFFTAFFAAFAGLVIGVYASTNKVLDHILMRVCDGIGAIPGFLLAIALMAVLGASWQNVVIALALVYTPSTARIVRSQALVVNEKPFIEAMRVQGASKTRVVWRHIVPNVLSPLLVQTTTVFAEAILSEATLSFLGLGINPPQASWGGILQQGKTVIAQGWWMIVEPGVAIVVSVLSLMLLGDGLRDALDPHTQGGGA